MPYGYANTQLFKGITSNRNNYSEISLFYIATNFYIWQKEKKGLIWVLITSLIAVLTTIVTHSVTSIICTVLLLLSAQTLSLQEDCILLMFS